MLSTVGAFKEGFTLRSINIMICLTSISLDVISVRKVGSSGPSITNNSIVNGLSISDIPDSRRRRNVPDGPVFTVQCTTVQGDHDPVWIMGDSIVTSNTSYLTVTQLNRYVSTLEVTLNQQTAAERYTCRSAVSGVSITFLLVTGISLPFTFSNLKSFPLSDNPYISRVSPSTVTTFLGNSVTMTYLAAYNSAGFNNLINRLVVVFTAASTGNVNYNFGIADKSEVNQYRFLYSLPSVGPWHGGVYTVRTQSESVIAC